MSSISVTAAAPDEVVADWAELAERIRTPPFLEPGWVLAWHRAFGHGRLTVLTARRRGRLVAALPVVARAGGIRSPTNWHTPDYGIAAEDPDAASALLRAMFARRPRSVIMRFAEPATAAAVRGAAAPLGFRLFSRVLERSPYLSLDGQFDDYRQGLPSKRRNDLARRRRRLEDRGPVELNIRTDATDEVLAEFVRLEDSGWKAKTSLDSDARARAFYADVARWAAGRGLLRVAFLRVGGRGIAADLALEDGHAHYLLKTGYDPAYRQLAPGMLLRYAMLERAFATGLKSYEFLGADAPWKLEWTNLTRERLAVHAFAPSLAGRIERGIHLHGRPLAKRVLAREWRSTS